MKKLSLRLLLLLLSAAPFMASAEAVSEGQCINFNQELRSFTKQLPIQVDYTTELVGLHVIYLSNTCVLTYSYGLNTNKFVKGMMQENDLSYDENLNFLKTHDGRAVIQESLEQTVKNMVQAKLKQFTEIEDIKIQALYQCDDMDIPLFTMIGLDTSRI